MKALTKSGHGWRRTGGALGAALGLVIGLGAAVALPATPAHAQDRCTYGSSSGNTYTCINANSGGADAQATIRHRARSLDVCLTNQWGGVIDCTGYQNVTPGHYLRIGFRGRLQPELYCADTYRSGTEIGHICAASNY